MSPSWISRRFKGSTGPKASVGIAMGRREVCVVHAMLGEKGAHIQTIETAPLPDAMFTGSPTPATESNLASVFAKVARTAKDKFIPCHVALPDPATAFAVFELDELPKSGKTRLDLVRWRFAKEYSVGSGTFDCVHQALGRDNGKHLLLGQGMDKAWLQCIKQALRGAGITPWSINPGACYRFNQFHDRFAGEKHGAAMIMLDPDSWAVFLWDAAARPRLARARWRTRTDKIAEDHDEIALEAERLILSYVRSGRKGAVTRVYAVSHSRELEGFTATLDRRLREKCLPLMMPGRDPEGDRKMMDHGLASVSLTAALAS